MSNSAGWSFGGEDLRGKELAVFGEAVVVVVAAGRRWWMGSWCSLVK